MNKEIYEKNLNALKTTYAYLHNEYCELLNAGHSEHDCFVDLEEIVGKRGYPSFTLRRKSDGSTVHGHSIFDPPREAEKKLSQFTFDEEERIVQLGFGYGYEIRAILSKMKHKHMVVIEPFFSVFKSAMENVDISDIISSGRVIITLITTPEKLKYSFIMNTNHMCIPNYKVAKLPHIEFCDSLADNVSEAIKQVESFITLNFNTAITAGAIFQRNTILNLSESIDMPGINALKNGFKDRPVFVVAPGPSLQKNGELLKQVKGKELIIACDTAVKPLARLGVKPDIVCTIDFQVLNYYKFRKADFDDIVLAASFDVSYFIPRDHTGRSLVYFHRQDYEQIFKPLIGEKGNLSTGGSVLTDAFSIAELCGANPLIFVGADLGFPGNKFYSDGSFDEGASTKLISDGKIDLLEVEDIHGEKILTYRSFFEFLSWLGQKIVLQKSVSSRSYIDATEGGAKITGTEIMSLQDAINLHVKGDHPPVNQNIDTVFANHTVRDKTDLIESVSTCSTNFQKMSKIAGQALKTSKKARKTIDASSSLEGNSKLIKELKQINKRRIELQDTEDSTFMHFVGPLINWQIAAINYYTEDESIPKKERYLKMIDLEINSFHGIEKSCSAMVSHFDFLKHKLELEAGDEYV